MVPRDRIRLAPVAKTLLAMTAMAFWGGALAVSMVSPPRLTVSMATEAESSLESRACTPGITMLQTIPVGDFDIAKVPGAQHTWEALVDFVNHAQHTLDVTAMYFDLGGTADRQVYTENEMKNFGADRGTALLNALDAAAQRNVTIRLVLGTLDSHASPEVTHLLRYPHVSSRVWNPKVWYGGGIMHAKVMVADGRAAYVGSANMDWKSLAQVKELGAIVRVCNASNTAAIDEFARFFNVLWAWSALVPGTASNSTIRSIDVLSPVLGAYVQVPSWDPLVPAKSRAPVPFTGPDYDSEYNAGHPFAVVGSGADDDDGGDDGDDGDGGDGDDVARGLAATGFVAASPPGAVTGIRTPDVDALVYTIDHATSSLCLSVMDFLPASAYNGGHGNAPVYWPALTDAVLRAVFHRPIKVRLLTSHWPHTSTAQVVAMQRLQDGIKVCKNEFEKCPGSLEVREYFVPGHSATANEANIHAKYPSYTRVNHAKYIVTDKRVNIGTSNWEWGYFAQTAGLSFNTNATNLVTMVQQVFDRDWDSTYARSISDDKEGGDDDAASHATVRVYIAVVVAGVAALVGVALGALGEGFIGRRKRERSGYSTLL